MNIKDFGEFLLRKRKEMNLTLKDLENLSGVSNAYLSQIENGKRGIPSPEILEKLAYPLEIGYNELMRRAGYVKLPSTISYQVSIKVKDEYYPPVKDNMPVLFVFGKNIKYFRIRNDINAFDVAKALNLDLEMYRRIEGNEIDVSLDTIDSIIDLFRTKYNADKDFDFMWDISYLSNADYEQLERMITNYSVVESMKAKTADKINEIINNKNKRSDSRQLAEELIDAQFVRIPIYGTIKAGYDLVAEQNIVGYELVGKKDTFDGEYFYLIVKGDSMIEDGIVDGCKVLVRKQSFVENGKIGVVIIDGDEATLKRVFYDGDNIILQAANKNVPPKVLPIDQVLIQGQVRSYVVDL
jgi:SOS-response transcriptional repressor LexA